MTNLKYTAVYVLLGLVLIPLLLKILTITTTLWWLRSRGSVYAAELGSSAVRPNLFPYELLDRYGARAVLPFGVKDYRLRRFLIQRNGLIKRIVLLWHSTFYQIYRLFLISAVAVVVTSLAFAGSDGMAIYTAWTVIFLGELALFLMAVEAVASYAALGSYLVAFHRFSPRKGLLGFGSPWLQEMNAVMRGLSANVILAATAVFLSIHSGHSPAFGGLLNPGVSGLLANVHWYIQGLYFATTTVFTIGYGDIHPTSILGQTVVVCLEINAFSFAAIVLAALGAAKERT